MEAQRDALIIAFLQKHGWENAQRHAIVGDASFRRYERLVDGEKSAILMDAPPPQEDVRPFVKVAHYLFDIGLSAPQIHAQDDVNGFLILEDLGNESFTKILNGSSHYSGKYTEEQLYKRALDVLIKLQQESTFPENTPPYDNAVLKREVLLLIDWYLPYIGLYDAAEIMRLREEYLTIWARLYPLAETEKKVLVYRDYHADNLMWLAQRSNENSVGLLDFQDALIGSPAYDLVSLLEDARRDVSPKTQESMLEYFIEFGNIKDKNAFKTAYAMLGAQRNSKIIGIFCRLAIRDNKPRYLSYLPRVWAHLEHDISHPALAELKTWMNKVIPMNKREPSAIDLPQKEAARA